MATFQKLAGRQSGRQVPATATSKIEVNKLYVGVVDEIADVKRPFREPW